MILRRWCIIQNTARRFLCKGYTYIFLPEEKRFEQIFIFDGLNVGSTFSDEEKCGTCYDKVSREITAYRDVETGQFLNSWNNTLTGDLNEERVSIHKVNF